MSVMDSNFYKLDVKKCNIENDDKSKTKFINWSVRNGLMYVKSVGHDYCDLTSKMMNNFETVMALINWKSLKGLDGISQNENEVKLWSKYQGKYFLIFKSCLTDNDIRIMFMNNEVRKILLALKSSFMKPHVMMMSMVTMRRELMLKIYACLCWPLTDVREEFDDKNSLAQPFDDKDCEDAEEKDVGKSSHLF